MIDSIRRARAKLRGTNVAHQFAKVVQELFITSLEVVLYSKYCKYRTGPNEHALTYSSALCSVTNDQLKQM